MNRPTVVVLDNNDHFNSKKIVYEIDENGCHNCISHGISARGYPICGRKVDGIPYWRMSRYIWYLNYGHISSNVHVLHRCDNPLCINPAHLFLGTNDDNVSDKVYKNRQARHSELTDNQIYQIKVNIKDTSAILANKYGVSDSIIRDIWNEKIHRGVAVDNYNRIIALRKERQKNLKIEFSDDDLAIISGGYHTNEELSKMFSCSVATISRAKRKFKGE